MRALVFLVLISAALAGPSFAQEPLSDTAPDSADWDLVQDSGRLTMATLDFGTNALAIRCQQDVFEFVLTGVPAVDTSSRVVSVTVGSRPLEKRYWSTQPGATHLYAAEPERLARQLREGGVLDIRLEPATDAEQARRYQFPVPPSAAAVNQVLTACDERLEDDRDAIPRAGPVRWALRPTPYYPDNDAAVRARAGRVELTCIVAEDFGLRNCRVEAESPANSGFGASALRAAAQARLDAAGEEAPVPGTVVSFPIAFLLP